MGPSEHICARAQTPHPGNLPCVQSLLSTGCWVSQKVCLGVSVRCTEKPEQTVWLTQYTAGEACVLSHSAVSDSVTPRTVGRQAPLSMGFSRQEYWSGLSCPPPWDLPNPEIQPSSPTLQADSLPPEPSGKPRRSTWVNKTNLVSASSVQFQSLTSRRQSGANFQFRSLQGCVDLGAASTWKLPPLGSCLHLGA